LITEFHGALCGILVAGGTADKYLVIAETVHKCATSGILRGREDKALCYPLEISETNAQYDGLSS
jgi:hypothetical protein